MHTHTIHIIASPMIMKLANPANLNCFPFQGTHGPIELRLADEPSDSSKPGLGVGIVAVGILGHQLPELGAWHEETRIHSDHM